MEVASGHVTDRPFARAFYTIAARRFTGDLVLTQADRPYKVSWEDGRITAGESASPSDQPLRVALTSGLINSTIVSQVLATQSHQPRRDQLALISELGRLSGEQIAWLKRRSLAMRGARLFSLAEATYSLNNARSLVADPDVPPIDARWLIYFGVITHYSLERLERETAPILDKAVRIADDAVPSLSAFGFTGIELPCLQRLQAHAFTIPDLATASPELERHKLLSVLYTLVACDCLTIEASRTAPAPVIRSPAPESPRTGTARNLAQGTVLPQGVARGTREITRPRDSAEGSAPTPGRAAIGSRQLTSPAAQSASPPPPRPARPPAPPDARSREPSDPPPTSSGTTRGVNWDTRTRARASITREQLTQTAKGRKATHAVKLPTGFKEGVRISQDEVRELIRSKLQEMDDGADHFALLGLTREAMEREIHEAYFHLAKRLHPDRLRAVGAMDLEPDAQRLFARINQAFAVLTNPKRLADYRQLLAAGGESAVRQRQADAEQMVARIAEAEEHFRQGDLALRRNQYGAAAEQFQRALDLNPDEGEHHASLAWAMWCDAIDKGLIATEVIQLLAQGAKKSPNSAIVWLYRGMVARQRGDTKTAKVSFKRVLEIAPDHMQAQTELRLLAKDEEGGGGLFGRKRR